jgi:hypothetical protein
MCAKDKVCNGSTSSTMTFGSGGVGDGEHVLSLDVGGTTIKGRDSPNVKHYPQIKNPFFVTCVNSALCS